MTVLVTAAHGNQGRLLIPKLAKAGIRVRALRGTGAEADLLALGAAEAITGDGSDPKVQEKVLAGVKTVYYVGPAAHPQERAMGLSMVDAAAKAGVQHFIFSSVLHPILTGMIHHAFKRDIEEHLICSDLNFTILQPADYMQVKRWNVFETGISKRRWSADRREALVDLQDVTDVVLKVATEGASHYGATYQLVGDHLDGHQITDTLSRVAEKKITMVDSSSEEFSSTFLGAGKGDPKYEHTLKVLNDMKAWYGTYDFIGNANVLTMLLGRKPNTFEAMLHREFAAFNAAGR